MVLGIVIIRDDILVSLYSAIREIELYGDC